MRLTVEEVGAETISRVHRESGLGWLPY